VQKSHRSSASKAKDEERHEALFHDLSDGFVRGEIFWDETGKPMDFRHLAAKNC
jgi:hypothetical protein